MLFQDVKELLRPTMSGASSGGLGSPASSTPSPEEIIQAKEVLKATLDLDLASAFLMECFSVFCKAIKVLARSHAFSGKAEAALLYFEKEL